MLGLRIALMVDSSDDTDNQRTKKLEIFLWSEMMEMGRTDENDKVFRSQR